MSSVAFDSRRGKVLYDGRTLAEWCPDVVSAIVYAVNPVEIILFGSVARGDDGPDSDVDLLVVLDSAAPATKLERAVTARASAESPVPVDLFVTDMTELAERGDLPGLLRVAIREGRRVYARAS
ncbi:MAG: nucleotidyltransferase domain-containing protein [Acidimicrobiales bacterium]